MNALQSHNDKSRSADELVFQSLIETAGDPANDQPPPRPEGVHSKVDDSQPTYSKMMATLVDQVKQEVDESKSDDRYGRYIKAIKGHLDKVQGLQSELHVKLAELEQEESRKITSDSIHTGFDSSHVSKEPVKAPSKKSEAGKIKSVEVLNPGTLQRSESISSGAEADVEEAADDGDGDEEERIEPTKLGNDFAKIKVGNYKACLQFINENPAVVAEREENGLLVAGFNNQLEGKDEYARQCVHQALLLQYCRQLGRDGVGVFFKRYVFILTVTKTNIQLRSFLES